MNTNNFSRKAGVAVALSAALLSMQVSAETASADISVTVNNAITFVKNTDLNFGDVRARASLPAGECSGLYLPANPASPLRVVDLAGDTDLVNTGGTDVCTGEGDAVMTSLGTTPATRAGFTVSGAATFTDLTITIPETVTLNNPNPTAPDFVLTYIHGYRTSAPTGDVSFAIAATEGVATVTTDGTGGFTFNLGGALVTQPAIATTAVYDDTTYTGSMIVEVAY
ncbi:MAG: hypothetical protein KKF22_07120 [Gammaproteobacteria bacterium]|nr:hypothetical protein [Gammaproteobacteria bacterium]